MSKYILNIRRLRSNSSFKIKGISNCVIFNIRGYGFYMLISAREDNISYKIQHAKLYVK